MTPPASPERPGQVRGAEGADEVRLHWPADPAARRRWPVRVELARPERVDSPEDGEAPAGTRARHPQFVERPVGKVDTSEVDRAHFVRGVVSEEAGVSPIAPPRVACPRRR